MRLFLFWILQSKQLSRGVGLKDIWVPLSAALAQQRKVDTIANNVANANTPGFKKDRLVFKEYLTALEKGVGSTELPRKEWAPKDFYRSQGGEKAHVKVAASFTIFEQGHLTPTGNPLDIAINGRGFIEVLSPHGARYTRRGNLSISKNGLLVNDRGLPILGRAPKREPASPEGGPASFLKDNERVININPGRVTISSRGEIFVNGALRGKLSVVEFKDIAALRKEGQSLFINQDENNLILDKVASTIQQGFIEQSNVNAVEEMSELIKANRHFESIQRAVKNYDYISGKAVNDILRF